MRQALELALEALNTTESDCGSRAWEREQEAITAIKEVLAQPEQKFDTHSVPGKSRNTHSRQPEQNPVAVVVSTSRTDDGFRAVVETGDELLDLDTLLYTTPPQRTWVGLTDKEIDELWMSHHDDFGNALSATGYERAIEAKLKEKTHD